MNDSKDHKAAAEPPLDCRVGRHVWLLTTGSGTDGDEWNVESIHATPESAERALAAYQAPQKRADGSTYIRDATIEEWGVEE